MVNRIKDWWRSNISIADDVKVITDLLKCIDEKTCTIDRKLDEEYKLIKDELTLYKGMIESVGMAVPDMIWLKDLNGRYMYANNAIREGLLCHSNPVGLNDAELAGMAKRRFGDANHTFGEKCANSDCITVERNASSRFLENGKVRGKMLYLEVFKTPLYAGEEMVGVCGVGRDITEYVEAYRSGKCRGCDGEIDIFKKYEFQPDEEN